MSETTTPAPESIPVLKAGERVRLNGRHMGVVRMASENGCSVVIALDDGLRLPSGVCVNFAALLIDYAAQTVTELITGESIEIERAA